MTRAHDAPRVDRETVSLGRFTFDRGGSVSDLRVAYETYGDPADPVVLVCHALTGSQRVASLGEPEPIDAPFQPAGGQSDGWWTDVVGPGKAIDTDRYRVVCANVPGSCYGTTGPASVDPETGEPYGSDFPPVTVGDWTRAQRALLTELGVDRLHAVVGGSVGGMNAVDWARQYPDDVERVVPIAAGPRLDAQLLAVGAIRRRAIRSDPNWNGGDYYGGDRPTEGLALARQLGHVAYLSKDSMAERFGRDAGSRGRFDPFPPDPAAAAFPYRSVESYLDYQASGFVERFDPNSYLQLTRAMDHYDLAEGHESDAEALAEFDGEVLVMSFTGDWHFTVDGGRKLTEAFRSAGTATVHHVVESEYGHDAFLVEPGAVGPPLSGFLDQGVRGYASRRDSDPDDRRRRSRRSPDRDRCAPVHASLLSG